jgi:hypothetical protein
MLESPKAQLVNVHTCSITDIGERLPEKKIQNTKNTKKTQKAQRNARPLWFFVSPL